MALVIEFTCDLPTACMRVRPVWSKRCVTVFHRRLSGGTAPRDRRKCQSALAIIGSNTLKGDACQLVISGEDEAEAFAALTAFIAMNFPTATRRCPLRQRWMSSRCQSRFRG
jgi:fructose-specific PTS system IIA-like component